MSARFTIDPMHLARSGECRSGELPVASFPRLLSTLASDAGMVRYRLCGRMADGRPTLDLWVDADVSMTCQRCLEAYAQTVRIVSTLPLARDELEMQRWEADDPLLDVLVADPALDVLDLVEDEMLLGLPLVPRHADGECMQAAS